MVKWSLQLEMIINLKRYVIYLINQNLQWMNVLKRIQQRVKHREELIPMLTSFFATKPTAYWQEKCQENNIPCGPIQNLEEVVQ